MNRRTAARTIGLACAGAWIQVEAGTRQGQKGASGTEVAMPPEPVAAAAGRIATNQCGYRPGDSKVATVALPAHAADQEAFTLQSANGDIVLSGSLSPARLDPASGDRVAFADFSALRSPGTYRLGVPGAVSDPIEVGPAVYGRALSLAMRAFYGQRCGCKVDLGGGYRHKACHKQGEFHASSGKQGKVKNNGGWHDAGDYGRYVVNSGISTATLLWAWEMFPGVLEPLRLQLPRSRGKTPDFLLEVRWNLQWMLAMQDPADGGVWHKQTSEHFCGFVMPERDTLSSEVIGTGAEPYKSTGATADLAAVMAIAARCYQRFDPAFAADCLRAARAAYMWAKAHPDVPFRNPPGVTTGEYGDRECSDERLWAAAELYRTTGEPQFREDFEAGVPAMFAVTTPSWAGLQSFALWTYAMSGRDVSAPVRERIVSATRMAAQQRKARAAANGYGHTLDASEYVWGSNSVAANHALLLLVADRLEPDAAARDAALANLHYLLGRNCFGVSWVTHVGARPFQQPHHRPSQADGIVAPWPGLLSGGPNAHGGDPVADRMPKQPPMRMWTDDWQAYSMNEVAINWNAPLVFLLAAANSAPAT